MKTVLIAPPQWTPSSPYLSIPLLLGQLIDSGYDAKGIDLNIEFYSHILSKKYVCKAIENINNFLYDFENDVQEKSDFLSKKYEAIKSYKSKNEKYFSIVPEKIESAVKVFKSKKDFYDPEKFSDANLIIYKALDIISLEYYPSGFSFIAWKNDLYKYSVKDVITFSKDSETNMFLEFYENQIKNNLFDDEIKLIGISITGILQIFPGLTLARMLKEKTKAKIVLGGNYLGTIKDVICKYPEFFDVFCDLFVFDEGERSIVEIAKYINGEISIDEVSGILYKNKSGEIITNPLKEVKSLDEMAGISLSGFDLSKYLLPEIVFPLRASTGCYWGKCSFCIMPNAKTYTTKNVDKLINEIKEMKDKYGITNFEFVDESMSPSYLSAFSSKLLEEGLDVKYTCFARLEKEFTKDLLKKAKKSGLVSVAWGYESASDRLLELMNKGVNTKDRFKILKDSSNVGIWNHITYMLGFPSETEEELRMTLEKINKNLDIIDSTGFWKFALVNDEIISNAKYYGVVDTWKDESELLSHIDFEATGMSREKVDDIFMEQCKFNHKFSYPYFRKQLTHCFSPMLYVVKYGVKKVKSFKIQ